MPLKRLKKNKDSLTDRVNNFNREGHKGDEVKILNYFMPFMANNDFNSCRSPYR